MDFVKFWSELPNETRLKFDANSQVLNFKRGERIYKQGDNPSGLYYIDNGLVGLVIIGEKSGKEHLMRIFRQNHFFGHRSLFSDEGYHGTTVALINTTVRKIPKEIFMSEVEKQPILLKSIVRVLSKELRRCENNQITILESEVLSRTAQALIYLKDLHPEHNWTRQEIANFTASTVSTIIKTLADLEARGYISQDGRSITILDREGLLSVEDREED